MKNIVLIRHGESLGQTARRRGQSRSDPRLVDCFLSSKGIQEASQLRSNGILNQYDFDLVCTSPLSRALLTCILALGHIIEDELLLEEKHQSGVLTFTSTPVPSITPTRTTRTPFIARADICEIGKGIPENQGRPLGPLVKDLKKKLSIVSSSAKCMDHIDFSMLPISWPEIEGTSSGRKHGVASFLAWLTSRPEENVAIVCHYNVIKWMLQNAIDRVPNCTPIECILTDEGELLLKSDLMIQKRTKMQRQQLIDGKLVGKGRHGKQLHRQKR